MAGLAPRLIVTRPAAQADAWVAELQALACDAQALPLIAIEPPRDTKPVQVCWQHLADYALVMFVSANAVQHFFALRGHAIWPAGTQAASTGPGTSAALRRAGLAEAAIVEPPSDAPSFDSEALWAQLVHREWTGQRALVVRGEDGRDWLADVLRGRGATVDFVAAYSRCAPQPDAAGLALLSAALADPAGHLWIFSSSEAVGHLRELLPAADWSRSAALASHPRIVEAARAVGFGQVSLVAPTAAAVARAARTPSIQSAAL